MQKKKAYPRFSCVEVFLKMVMQFLFETCLRVNISVNNGNVGNNGILESSESENISLFPLSFLICKKEKC